MQGEIGVGWWGSSPPQLIPSSLRAARGPIERLRSYKQLLFLAGLWVLAPCARTTATQLTYLTQAATFVSTGGSIIGIKVGASVVNNCTGSALVKS
jgi:hypothetical protein